MRNKENQWKPYQLSAFQMSLLILLSQADQAVTAASLIEPLEEAGFEPSERSETNVHIAMNRLGIRGLVTRVKPSRKSISTYAITENGRSGVEIALKRLSTIQQRGQEK